LTYLTTGHLGTPVLATDAVGAEVWSRGFEPFGEDWKGAQEAGVFMRLPGQWESRVWEEAEMGAEVYYNVRRWYSPGRGLLPDPGRRPVGCPLLTYDMIGNRLGALLISSRKLGEPLHPNPLTAWWRSRPVTGSMWALLLLAGLVTATAMTGAPGSRGPAPDGVSLERQRELRREIAVLDLHAGDMVFRRRSSYLSRRVLTHDPASRFSHVGLLVPAPRFPRGLGVVHVVPAVAGEPGEGRVELTPVSEFLDAASTLQGAFYRVQTQEVVRDRAAGHGLAYFAEGRTFDGAFDLAEQGRLYCTELVWAAYRDAGLDLIAHPLAVIDFLGMHRRPVLKPSDLLRNEGLELVWDFAMDSNFDPEGNV
jgi:hypothetical protein